MKFIRIIRRWLAGNSSKSTKDTILFQQKAFATAFFLVRAYYAVTLFLIAGQIKNWAEWLPLEKIFPLWPVSWVEISGIPTAVHFIMALSLVSSLLSTLFPEKRIFRVLLFIGLLEFLAFNYSFGRFGHSWHGWLSISFILIFLPDGKDEQLETSITKRQKYLTTFWAAQALVLGFYSLSGFWKISDGIFQLIQGEISAFVPEAFAYQIANKLRNATTPSLLGPFIIEHPYLGWPMYLGGMYFHLFSIVAAFRFSLHRFWGVCLIFFHLGTYLMMSISFSKNILFLALFFLCSPFAHSRNSWRMILQHLPVIGWFNRQLRKRFV